MELINISQILKKIITSFFENHSNVERKIFFQLKNELFYLSFIFGGKTVFNPEQLNGSHEEVIIYKIEHFIESKSYQSGELQFVFNYNNDESYKFYLYIIKIEELIIGSELQKKLEQKRIENIEQKKLEKINENIEKIYKIISWNKNGISLGQIIQKTRFFKTKEERKKTLQELVNQGKITLEFNTSNGKNKKIYKPI